MSILATWRRDKHDTNIPLLCSLVFVNKIGYANSYGRNYQTVLRLRAPAERLSELVDKQRPGLATLRRVHCVEPPLRLWPSAYAACSWWFCCRSWTWPRRQ